MASSFNRRAFQSLGALRALNVSAVGLALSAVSAAVFAHIFSSSNAFGGFGIFVGLPTLVVGALWAMVLRSRKTIAGSRLRWGWLASIPLAILNAGVACGLMFLGDGSFSEPVKTFAFGAVLGATVGAIFWIPALIATLVSFGIPIAWSQKQAEKGLAGEERGEMVIGAASTFIALLGVLLLLGGHKAEGPRSVMVESIGYLLMWICAFGGIATGSAAALLAQRREARRKAFVKEVEAGEVQGFRVDVAPEGKVLVRVTSMGQGYRVANFEEELVALDELGEAKKTLRAS